jgi:hypothetical protein
MLKMDIKPCEKHSDLPVSGTVLLDLLYTKACTWTLRKYLNDVSFLRGLCHFIGLNYL